MRNKKGIPPFTQIQNILLDEMNAKIFLIQNGILNYQIKCPECQVLNTWNLKNKSIQCSRRNCRCTYSVLQGTFFENSKIKINTILCLAYCWLLRVPVTSATCFCDVSDQTACSYYSYFENLIADLVAEHHEKIGGPGVIVEISKSKFGERKYHRGHRVIGTKLIAAIERTNQKRFFAIPVDDYSKDTIYFIIKNNIECGSILYTDLKKSFEDAFDQIISENDSKFTFKKQDHHDGFVSPGGIHINNLRGTLNGAKCTMNTWQKSKDKCPINLMTFIWRRQNKLNLWNAFIDALKSVKTNE